MNDKWNKKGLPPQGEWCVLHLSDGRFVIGKYECEEWWYSPDGRLNRYMILENVDVKEWFMIPDIE